MPRIDHSYVENIVCPWCGYEYDESYLYEGEEEELECESCLKKFLYTQKVDIKYSTHRDQADCPHEDSDIYYSDHLGKWIFDCDSCDVWECDANKEHLEEVVAGFKAPEVSSPTPQG